MDALERSTGSSERTRSRPRAAPLTVPPATRLARGRRGSSSRRFLDRNLLSLPSQPYSTALPSLKRYDNRYEVEGRTNFLERRTGEVRRISLLGTRVNKARRGTVERRLAGSGLSLSS